MSDWEEGRAQFADIHYITSEDGRHRGPSIALDPDWDQVTKLRWQAALVEHSTGVRIYVHRYDYKGYETFSLNVGRASLGNREFHDCWTILNGVDIGVEEFKRINA